MEILTIILFMLVPLIFKGIEKGLSKGVPQQSVSSEFEDEDDLDEDGGDNSVVKTTVEYVPVKKLTEIQPVKQEEACPVVTGDEAVEKSAADIETKDKKEKIDAKKLIIYSEIMKPKY